MNYIAKVQLAAGQCGYYDDISGVRLTLFNKTAEIMPGVNTVGLSNAVSMGRILIVEGSLENDPFADEEIIEALPTQYRILNENKKEELRERMFRTFDVAEKPVTVEAKEVEVAAEEESIKEEVAVEKPVAKKTRKKAVKEEVVEEK